MAKTELEEAGLDTELMATSTSTLRDKIMAITNIHGGGGFDILTDTGSFKSTYDIILGISKVWDELGKTDPVGQAALLELLAGKRQGNALAAALTNMKDGVAATEASFNSAGSAAKEYDKWQNSIEAHLKSLGASWEAFSVKALKSDSIIGVVDLLTGLSNVLGEIAGKVDIVGVALIALSGVLGAMTSVGLNGFANMLNKVFVSLGFASGAATTAAMAFSVMIPVAAVIGGLALFNKLNVTLDEQKSKLSDITDKYKSVTEEIDSLTSKQSASPLDTPLTANEQIRLDYLQKYKDVLLATQAVQNRNVISSELFGVGDFLSNGMYGEASALGKYNAGVLAKRAIKSKNPEKAQNTYSTLLQNQSRLLEIQGTFLSSLSDADVLADPALLKRTQNAYEYVTKQIAEYQVGIDALIGSGLVSYQEDVANATKDVAEANQAESDSVKEVKTQVELYTDSTSKLTTAHSALSSALEQQNQDGYLSVDSYKALIEANSGYADSLEMVNGKLQINIDKAYDVTRGSVAEQVASLQAQQALSKLTLSYESANGASDDRIEALKQEVIQYDILIESLIDSRSALNEYKSAAATANSGANYDYASSEMKKTFEEGTASLRTQTDEFQKAAEYFTGQQAVTAEQASMWMEKNGTWLNGTVDGLNAFRDAAVQAGVVIQQNGQYIMAEGMTTEIAAQKLGTSAELVRDTFSKFNEYEGQNWKIDLTPPTQEDVYKSLGVQEYIDAYDEIMTYKDNLQGDIPIMTDRSAFNILNIIDKIDTTKLKDTIDQLSILNSFNGGKNSDQLASLQNLYNIITNADTTSLGETISTTITDATGNEYPINLTAGSAISSIHDQILAMCSEPYSISFTPSVSGLFASIFGSGSKSGHGLGRAGGTANAGGSSAANGRYKTISGRTLVGELGQEIVVDMSSGKWYTVGDYGAEFTSLPANAIVFNHVQTQSILKNGKINNRGQAMAGGNAAVDVSSQYSISGGGKPLKGTPPKKKYDTPKTVAASSYDDDIKALEHQIKIISDMMNLYAEGSQSWFEQQSNMIETYKREAQLAQTEYDRLKASGKDVNSEEMRSLLETLVKYKTEIFKESEAYWEAEKENAKTTLSYYKDQTQAVIDLKTSYHNLVKEVQSEQISIDKELQTAASAYPFLTAAEQAAVFDDADYRALSDELSNISNQANAMYLQYLDQIKSVGEDDAYLLDSITDEFKRQYDLQMDSYNVAKARLGVIKAEKNLENVKGERSVAALIGGVWTWIADSENVKSALEELSQAEQDLASAQSDAQFNSDVANLESTVTAIDQQIDAIDNLVYSMDDLATEVHSLVDTMQSNITAAMSASTLASFDALKNYTGTSTSLFNTSTLQDLIAQNLLGSSSLYTTNISSGIDISTILKNLKDIILPITTGSSSLGDFVNVGQITITGDVASQFIALLRSVAPLG